MKNLNIELIKKYANGETLEEYTKEELENDKDFMMGVLIYTKDLSFYNSCSKKLKKDYNFVKHLVLKFKDNSDFIMMVADYYLDNPDSDIESIELNILMSELLPSNLACKYVALSEIAYYNKRIEYELAKTGDESLESAIGEGFLLLFDSYSSSEIILKYFAELMIKEIIRDYDINLETMLHNQFNSPEEINKVGINNFILKFIAKYDAMLSSYLMTHLNLIKNIRSIIKEVQKNWYNYNARSEATRYNKMLDMVHEYMSMADSNLDEEEILYYVAKELGIKEKVKKYDFYPIMEDDLDEEFRDDMVRFEIENNPRERLVYLNVRKIMINQIFSEKPKDLYSLIDEKRERIVKLNLEK